MKRNKEFIKELTMNMKLKFIEGLRAIHAAGNAKIGPISISIEFYS